MAVRGGGGGYRRKTKPRRDGVFSGGYHGDLSIPDYVPETPTVAPPPSQAATQPAGTYAGATAAFQRANTAAKQAAAPAARANPPAASPFGLLELNDLLTPGPTARENAEAAMRLGVKPPQDSGLDLRDIGKAVGSAVDSFVKGANDVVAEAREVAKLPSQRADNVLGRKTLGKPTLAQVLRAADKDQVRVNQKGKITVPATRKAARRLAALREKKAQIAAPLPGLDPNQERVARTVLRQGERMGATRKEMLAAIETGLVESNLRNLSFGDRDSEGWRQERTSIYGTGPTGPTNVREAAKRFFEESAGDTGGTRGAGMTAGQLAQTIQASAHPERYDLRKPEAASILGAYERGGEPPPKLAAQLKAATEQARRLGIPTQTQTPAQRYGQPDKQTLTRFKAAAVAAKELERAKLPYVWGGGHGDPASRPTGGGLDCSGAVSYVLNKMGAMKGSLVSGDMGSVLQPGPGAVTVFYNAGHTFMKIGDRYFGTSRTNPGGGPGFIEGKPDDLSKYNVGHVPGLGGKVALQLGVDLSGGGATAGGGGIVYGPDGTTATVTGGAKKGAAGFSDRPIVPSVTTLEAPTAASAPLPAAFQQFQQGEEGESESSGELDIIERLLRKRRL